MIEDVVAIPFVFGSLESRVVVLVVGPCVGPESERAYKPVAFGGAAAVRATVIRETFAPTLRAP